MSRALYRLHDIILASLIVFVLAPIILAVMLLVLFVDGRPVFYIARRMSSVESEFGLVKFRTMSVVAEDEGVSGGNKSGRITRLGRFLRKTRLDELPQLWNVMRGDIRFVGPRPPLREYVERYPAIYKEVLKVSPGITGFASLHFHRHEEWLLARAKTARETDEIYCRACIPRKARLDMLYEARRTFCTDALLMLKTVRSALR